MNTSPTQQFPKIVRVLPLCVLVAAAAWWFWPDLRPEPKISGPLGSGILEPFRTPGGTLHTNGITKTEEMRNETGSWRGTTTSGIRLNATYRYEIELRNSWNIHLDKERGIVFVVAPEIYPQLPVAVDSRSVQTWSSSGWGRFDKWEHLADLQKEMSNLLEKKAKSKGYRDLARGEARTTVEEFVRDWIIKQKGWENANQAIVKVYFSDEDSIPYPEGMTLKDFLP